jgi:hypothetical protein
MSFDDLFQRDGVTKRRIEPLAAGPFRADVCAPQLNLISRIGVHMKKPVAAESASASIDAKIKELGDWRGETLAKIRQLIHDADPDIQEEWKWAKPKSPGTPVWSHDGIVCTGETYKSVVKTTFARGAALKDPSDLFNSSLEGNVRRAIDFREDEKINEGAFKQLIRAAVEANSAVLSQRQAKKNKKK